MFEVHISKHSLFRLKITVGCRLCAYPSIHVETPSRSRSVVDCARVQVFTFLLTKTLSRSRSVVWCVVWCVVFFVCTCGVVCGVGGVWVVCVHVVLCVVCGEAWHTLSLSLALSPSSSLSLSFSLLSFFFSLLFLLLSSFSFAPSLTLALALVLSLLSSFFPSTHSSLLFPSRQ